MSDEKRPTRQCDENCQHSKACESNFSERVSEYVKTCEACGGCTAGPHGDEACERAPCTCEDAE